VPSKILRLAAVVILAASQMVIAERAFARGGTSSGMSRAGHFVASHHFGHDRFSHRLRRSPVFIAPYGWDWPYADYGDVPSAGNGNTTIVAYPAAVSSGRATDDCRWNEETFTVQSSAGGTRPIQVGTCR
jgi:hypothetical protein